MKKSILVLLLILSFTTQSFAGIKVDVEVNKDSEVEVTIDSSHERDPIAIQIYDDDRRYYIDQDVTNKDGSAEFYFQLEGDKEYDGKVNINGRQKKFSFSTEEVILYDTAYVHIKGYEGTILSKTEVEIEEDDRVIDVLKKVLEDEGVEYKIKHGYVKSIDGQAEFDLGAKSGWMFSINDEFPEIGAGNVEVEDGDYIKWLYTTDLGEDIGALDPDITEDELDDALEKARIFLKSVVFSEKDMIKRIKDIIELIEDNYSEIDTRKDAEALADYTGDTLRIVEAVAGKIESKKYQKEVIKILKILSEFLVESSELIREEEMKNEVKVDASKVISILLRLTPITEGNKDLDDDMDEIIDSMIEIISEFDKKKKLEIKISHEDKDEIEINFPKGFLENVLNKDIDRVEIKTEIVSFNIETDTFKDTDRKKEMLVGLKKVKELQSNMGVSLEIMIDGDRIYDLHGTIQVSIPYSGNEGNHENIDVFLLKDDGTKESIIGAYDTLSKSVEFVTSKLGKYTLGISEKIKREFTDLNNHDWAKDAVKVMVEKGFVNGRSDTEFDPNSKITRAEFATLIIRMLQYKTDDDTSIPFEDVDNNSWYYRYVVAAYKNGLINGRTEEEFDPQGNITRQEMAKVIANVLQNESLAIEGDIKLDSFKDEADIATWAKSPVSLAVKEGIITGMEDRRFAPTEKANRAQAVVILYRLYSLIKSKTK